jgi:hypothetical protein
VLDVMGRVNNNYYIRISENALIQLVLNGLEAYSVYHQGKKRAETRLETYGLLWGHETHLPNNNGILYSIELISVDTSAERAHSFCSPNDSALQLKRDIMTSFLPHYDFLGDFHTHPYKKYTDVTKNKCYNYSADDVILDCTALVGLSWLFTQFGRGKIGPGDKHTPGEI